MTQGKIALPLAIIWLVVSAVGSWAQSPHIGATVQTWHYDPQTNMVTLKIVK